MTKIPVAQTIERAYGFTFRHFLLVVGLSWIPLLILAIGAYFLLPPYFAGLQSVLVDRNPAALNAASGYVFLLMLLMIACFNMVYVAVARQVLGLRKGSAWFYFSLDATFWRLLGAYLLMLLLIVGVMILGAIVVALVVAGIAAASGAGVGAASSVVAAILIVAMFLYLSLRLMFFMTPVAVAEGHRVLRRSWMLSRGNFWRIFVVLLAFMIPFFIVEVILQTVLIISVAGSGPPPQSSDPVQMMAYFSALGTRIYALWPVLGPVVLILYTLIISLLISASAFAYRSLVPASEGIAAEFA